MESTPEQQSQDAVKLRTLLLVDDEENILSALRRLLRKDGYRILCAQSGQAGLEILHNDPDIDLIMSDQRMPQMTGTAFLRQARVLSPNSVRIVLSGYTDLESVTAAINEGAVYKFLTKPWDDEILRLSIKEALHFKWTMDENRMLQSMMVEINQEFAASLENMAIEVTQLRKDQSILRVLLEHLPLPAMVLNENGDVHMHSRSARDLLFPLSSFMPDTLAHLLKMPPPPAQATPQAQTLRICDKNFQCTTYPIKTETEFFRLLVFVESSI